MNNTHVGCHNPAIMPSAQKIAATRHGKLNLEMFFDIIALPTEPTTGIKMNKNQ